MKVLVCGSRAWTDAAVILRRLSGLPRGSTVIHGDARGADRIAAQIAARLGFKVEAFPANWSRYGKSAGLVRNGEMLDKSPDLVIAFWLDGSTGTGSTIALARKRGIPVEVVSDPEIAYAEELFPL